MPVAYDSTAWNGTRAARWWRFWTLLYFVALTTGTHWPQLDVSISEGPSPDKVLHLFAFGGLTLLLWQCRLRWLKPLWLHCLVVALWVVIDEWAQSLPILERETSGEDILAGWAGVLTAGFWLSATQPTGGQRARWRRMLFDQAVQLRLAHWNNWLALGANGIVIGLLVAVVSVVASVGLDIAGLDTRSPQVLLTIAFCLGFVFGVHKTFDHWWNKDRKILGKHCFSCGEDCTAVSFDEKGKGTCNGCGVALHHGQWIAQPRLTYRKQFDGFLSGLLIGSMLLLLIMFFVYMGPTSINFGTLNTVLYIALVVGLLSFITRIMRNVNAHFFDRVAMTCAWCGYDMRSTPIDRAVVRCPECGVQFALFNQTTDR